MDEEEIDYEDCPLTQLIELYEKKVEEFKKRNRTVNRTINPRVANTVTQKAQGRTTRAMLMAKAKEDIAHMGSVVKRRLAEEVNRLGGT